MGFFSNLFGGKKDKGKSSESRSRNKSQNYFLTNSNEFGFGEIDLAISGKVRVDGLLAISKLDKIAKERNLPFEFGVMYTTLLEEGALTVPVICSIGDDKYSLYFIYQEEDLLKYKDLIKHIKRTEYPNLIYFSSIPIYKGYEPKPIIEPFQLADLRVEHNAKVAGEYAMWWHSNDDPTFHNSTTYDLLNKMYQVFKGYETYLTGYVLRQTRIKEEMELERIRLPENHASYTLSAPEGKYVVLDLSQEKGIRFLFPIKGTTKEYRERFLKGVMVDFAAQMIPLRQQNFPIDEEMDPNSYDWFNFMARVVKQKEQAGEPVQRIGLMNLNQDLN